MLRMDFFSRALPVAEMLFDFRAVLFRGFFAATLFLPVFVFRDPALVLVFLVMFSLYLNGFVVQNTARWIFAGNPLFQPAT